MTPKQIVYFEERLERGEAAMIHRRLDSYSGRWVTFYFLVEGSVTLQ